MNRRSFLKMLVAGLTAAVVTGLTQSFAEVPAPKPNILFIFIDDMGYADPSCYGNTKIKTPHIDSLAEDGLRFTQFYVNSPLCSPSRVAMTTGQYPGRWGIHSYLNDRQSNKRRKMADYLDPKAPSLARQLKSVGYATAHFGKWHMGGGRDVDDAPHPKAYGFDESSVTFEGLGDRLLIKNDSLSRQSAELGQGRITWVEKHEISRIRVDQTLDFIKRHKDRPFYVNFWLNDVHDPFHPAPEQLKKFRDVSDNPYEQQFFAVLDEMDRQIGRLLKGLSDLGLDDRTLVIFTSDNGPTDWPRYYREGHLPPGDVGPLRGRKWSLYEGGIRMPFIVRWNGVIPAGKADRSTVACGVDLFPSLCKLAGAELPPGVALDGKDISRALLGKPLDRKSPVFWYYPNTPEPGKTEHISPMLAMREGDWKLLCNPDQSDLQLYNLAEEIGEKENLAEKHSTVAVALKTKLLNWFQDMSNTAMSKGPTYQNPVIDENLADPSVLVHEGVYYLYATGSVDGAKGYRVWTSSNLVDWQRGPVVFQPGRPRVWAPDVWRDPASGRFYLYYTVDRTVGVAEADNPRGPFVNALDLFENAIDAHLFRDEDGSLYLYYVQLPGFRITVQPMDHPRRPSGQSRVILQPVSAWEKRTGAVTEGPWVIKHQKRYYLLYSGSHAATPDYAVGYAVSDSPMGPFTRAAHNPIIKRSKDIFGPGHGCAVRDAPGHWWHVYHQKRNDRRDWDRFICIDPLWFDQDGKLYSQATRGTSRPASPVLTGSR